MKHGKKYVDSQKLVDRSNLYDIGEALDLAVKTGKAKFDETVEVHVKLGVDSRHADQQVRGAVVLPHGTGKTVRVQMCIRDRHRGPGLLSDGGPSFPVKGRTPQGEGFLVGNNDSVFLSGTACKTGEIATRGSF